MSEIEIDLEQGERVDVITHASETRTRWNLRDIQIDPESRMITVRFYSAVNGQVVHKTRSLSVEMDNKTMQESGYWIENELTIKEFVQQVLTALQITEVL